MRRTPGTMWTAGVVGSTFLTAGPSTLRMSMQRAAAEVRLTSATILAPLRLDAAGDASGQGAVGAARTRSGGSCGTSGRRGRQEADSQ